MLYDDFQPIVDQVLNNWTALQLAVEHGMGCPGGKKTAQLMSAYVARYCVENIVDRDDLTELLEDLMDEEFETTCQDNSPKEIAMLLLEFLELLKNQQLVQLTARLNSLPRCQTWLSQPIHKNKPPQTHGNPDDDTTSSSCDCSDDDDDDDDNDSPNTKTGCKAGQPEPMDEDPEPGWTVVKTRRKNN